jgi:hypothetical protein
MFASAALKSALAHGEPDRPRLWLEAGVWWSRALPGTATLNPRFKLLMLIAARRTERRERRFVVRDVGSGRSAVTGSIEAA